MSALKQSAPALTEGGGVLTARRQKEEWPCQFWEAAQ